VFLGDNKHVLVGLVSYYSKLRGIRHSGLKIMFRGKYQNYCFWLLKNMISNMCNDVKELQKGSGVKDYTEDVYLCSYPRSGNTWLRYLIAFYREPCVEWNLDRLQHIVPDIHYTEKISPIIPIPRVIKSHFLYDSNYSKVIYLVRDGRDVCVSYYDVQTRIHGYKGTFDDFIIDLCTERIWPSSWQKHVESWLDMRSERSILLIKYEDLFSRVEDVLLEVIQFVGLDWCRSRAQLAAQKASLEKIWGDHIKMGPHKHLGFKGGVAGRPGTRKKLFSRETEDIFLQYTRDAMKLAGYL